MLATKAESLEWLAPRLTRGRVLPLVHVRAGEWRCDRAGVLRRLSTVPFAAQPLIVRSSAVGEDSIGASEAGRYLSIPNVRGPIELAAAVDLVIESYGDGRDDHLVLVQPFLTDLIASGVVLTIEPSCGAPYFVVNYREGSDTSAVTAGKTNLRTFYSWHDAPPPDNPMLADLRALAAELRVLLGIATLDFEFAYTGSGVPVLFQVRPVVVHAPATASVAIQTDALRAIAARIANAIGPQPNLVGDRTLFGVMPDWNPAELIGVRPRPLALSLYRDLVTDTIWADQRHRYGYRDLRGHPLLVEFHGLPYIDVRVSFNSFVPADIDDALAARLVNHYISRLKDAPELHDKVEFEIVLSCYSFDLHQRLAALPSDSFNGADRQALTRSLRTLTNRIINRETGLWRSDVERVMELERRQAAMMATDLAPLARISFLLDDCKRLGTLSFAGLARTAFIATQLLRSLVVLDVLSEDDVSRFMTGLDSVSTALGRDRRSLSREAFLAKYGHLRPGTYDILSPRYDETPDRYFEWGEPEAAPASPPPFTPSATQTRAVAGLLRDHGLEHDAAGFFDFVRAGIRLREQAKFVFSRSVSGALALLGRLGSEHSFSLEDLSFADVGSLRRLRAGGGSVRDVLAASIARGREQYRITHQLFMPSLITSPDEVWQFHQPPTEPNFITQKEAVGSVSECRLESSARLDGRIVLLLNADPGFDWIFSRQIAGFVTAYGGANSHMAIRAGELGLPAVIGAGEPLYRSWAQARRLRLDCLNRQVQILA
jgi:glutamine kinase